MEVFKRKIIICSLMICIIFIFTGCNEHKIDKEFKEETTKKDTNYKELTNHDINTNSDYVENEILIKFKSGFDGKINEELKKVGVIELSFMFERDDEVWYSAYLKENVTVEDALINIKNCKDVIYAEPNYIMPLDNSNDNSKNNACKESSLFDNSFDKPIIYLYPKEKMKVSVKLGNPEKLTCTYPKYDKDGWNVIAKPDGKLIDTETGRDLYSLYWEGKGSIDSDFSEGFVVKGEDSIQFLEEKLKILGLNDYESEEFIVYWLPQLESNDYNFIRFATKEEIDKYMPLEVSGNPDSIIRILMQFKGLDEPINVKKQKLTTPERIGFTVVEWGGSELK